MKKNWKSIIGLIIVVGILIIVGIQLFPMFAKLGTPEGAEEFKQYVEGVGIEGVGIVLGIMVLQIFLPILPGEPIEILAGLIFGPFKGLLVILLGIFISTFLIILLVKFLGRKFLYSIIEEEKLNKFENHKLFQNEKKVHIILFILFFIPGTPKDLFIYLGALLPINTIKFLLIATFARIPSIISSTIAGGNILEGNWEFIVGVYAITFAIAGIILYIVTKKDKNLKEFIEMKGK